MEMTAAYTSAPQQDHFGNNTESAKSSMRPSAFFCRRAATRPVAAKMAQASYHAMQPSIAMPIAPATSADTPLRHRPYEDAQALFTGTLFVSITMILFAQAGLLTGSTAGVAFLLHYWTGLPFGAIFFAINLPFYWFSWRRMGREFTIKTFVSVAMLSLLTDLGPRMIHIDYLHPAYAAVLGGFLLGTGCLFLARHKASLGGATIISLYLQQAHGIRAGKVHMVIDCGIVALALFIVPVDRVAYSILGAIAMSAFLWINHRPGRYLGGTS